MVLDIFSDAFFRGCVREGYIFWIIAVIPMELFEGKKKGNDDKNEEWGDYSL